MSRICLLTGHDAHYRSLAALTVPQMRRYAASHGYDIRVLDQMDAGESPVEWAKIKVIRDALQDDVEFLLWIDADALIVRLDQDIRECISADVDLYMAWHGPDSARVDWAGFVPHYNSGVMLIRNTPWAHDFFSRVWDQRGRIRHAWNDQAAIHWVLGYMSSLGRAGDIENEADRSHVGRLESRWNSIPGVVMADDPVIHHYSALGRFRNRLIEADMASLETRKDSEAFRRAMSYQISMMCVALRLAPLESNGVLTNPRRLVKVVLKTIWVRIKAAAPLRRRRFLGALRGWSKSSRLRS